MRRTKSRAFARRPLVLLVGAALAGATTSGYDALAIAPGVPMVFERNDGQFPADVVFAARGRQGRIVIRSGEIALLPRAPGDAAIPLRFAGANGAPEIEAERPLRGASHHYIGNDPRQYVIGAPHFGALRMKDVYPGIDVAVHGADGTLEYDFLVAPRADPREVRIDLAGAKSAHVDRRGNLEVEFEGRTVTQHAPVAWQDIGAARKPVEARFDVSPTPRGFEARIEVGEYDKDRPLTIDPVLDYSTFLGSSGTENYVVMRAAADGSARWAYTDYDSARNMSQMVLGSLDPNTGSHFETTIGASGDFAAEGMYVSPAGDTYVAGYTNTNLLPVTNPVSGTGYNAFAMRFAPDLTLTRSRILGGSGADYGFGITTDPSGNAYLTGQTSSANFPITAGGGILNGGAAGSSSDAFVVKLDAAFQTVYARYLGGSGNDAGYDVAVDATGEAVVVGPTHSPDFPQVNSSAPLSPPPLTTARTRGFATRLTADGIGYVFSSFLGGSADSSANAIAIDPTTGDSIVVGWVAGDTLQPVPATPFAGGTADGFAIRLDARGVPTYASYIGGSGSDIATAVAVAPAGDILITGDTYSGDFPQINPLSVGAVAPLPGKYRAYVTRLRDGTPDFSSWLGGSGTDEGYWIAAPADNMALVAGTTDASNFPIVGGFRTTKSGPRDAFLSRIVGLPARTLPARKQAIDFDGNSSADLLLRHSSGVNGVWMMNGTAIAGAAVASAGTGYEAKMAADFDGNGKTDLLFRDAAGNYRIQLRNGKIAVAQTTLQLAGSGWDAVAKGDFNGDGRTDMIWSDGGDSYGIWIMNGGTKFTPSILGSPGAGFRVTHVGDFDGDGKADLLWQHPDGRIEIWLMVGAAAKAKSPLLGAGSGWKVTHVGDFNGDGKADVLLSHTDGSIGMWLMNGATILQPAIVLPGGSGWSANLVADLDGDGMSDVLLKHADGSVGGWLMNGTAVKSASVLLGAGSGWSVVATGDFDGDGHADLVWRATDGTYGVWLMNGLARSSAAVVLGGGTGWDVVP